MRLVLADSSVLLGQPGLFHNVKLWAGFGSTMVYAEVPVDGNQLLSQLLNRRAGYFQYGLGSLEVYLHLDHDRRQVELELKKYISNRSNDCLLEKLWNRYPSIKISVFVKFESNGTLKDFEKFQDMVIDQVDPKENSFERKPTFVCKGQVRTDKTSSDVGRTIHLKIVADVPTKILMEGVPTDVTLIAEDESEIRSYRILLSACSPVFANMFQGLTQTGLVEMNEYSEAAVRAFHNFVYSGDLKEPRRNVELAFEVLKISEKYRVQDLKNMLIQSIIKRGDKTISTKLAFRIRMFTFKMDDMVSADKLRKKARKVLKPNFEELRELREFRKLFRSRKTRDVGFDLVGDLI